jgi:hypothetical protein
LGVLLWGSLWIDPGWKDARKEVPLLDRVLRPFFPFFKGVEKLLGVLDIAYYAFSPSRSSSASLPGFADPCRPVRARPPS